jgi:glycerate 2-kinase
MEPSASANAARDAESIFRAALERADPAAMIRRCLSLEGGELLARSEIPGSGCGLEEERYSLSAFDRIFIAALGKAGASMALAVEEILGDRVTGGVAAVKAGVTGPGAIAPELRPTLAPGSRLRLIEAGHPLPDARSELAAAELLALGRRGAGASPGGLDERCLVLVLISGGGSAIACAPAEGLSLGDKAAVTGLLLGSGATIQETNCVRKHLSAIKGGRLAAAYAPATVLALVLSDVIGDDLDAIASGPTVPDSTSFADAQGVLRRYGLEGRVPVAVAERFRRGAAGAIADTPKPGDPAFARTRTLLVGSNRLALLAAELRAKELGYSALVLSSRLTGEAREAALMFLGIGKDIAASGFPLKPPACVIAGGETTVTLRGRGKGGRNQEMALAFLAALRRSPRDGEDLMFLAASTDGSDGPTDAAGAFASARFLERAGAAGLDPDAFLGDNDSYRFFDCIDGLLRTGPTGTNVCDLQILIVPQRSRLP